jgi:predicted ATPase
MRISFSGTSNTGKTTLLKNFLSVWSQYTTPVKTYRDVLVEDDHKHSSQTTTETQTKILNFMIDELQKTSKGDKIVFDRCPLDNLAYSLWAHANNIEGFDKAYIDNAITLTRESLRHLDIIFLLRYDPSIPIVDDGMRDTNIQYIQEVDNIFGALKAQFDQNYDSDVFFPKNDSPGLIELPTSMQRRIDIIGEYVTPTGDLYGEEDSILNPNNLDTLEQLVKQQKAALEQEEKEKELFKKFGLH